jgi:hypothetical protein
MAQVWIPPGVQYFRDFAGSPLSLGTIELYIPSTFTPKLSYQDEAGTITNTNPIQLDAAGSCMIWGTGLYRMIAKDQNGVQVFDKVTGFVASGGGGGGDVNGPGSSIPGDFAVWTSNDGTQIGDGGVVGALSHLNSVNDGNWAGTSLALTHGGTGGTDAASARTNLGLGALAVLSTITASYVTDFLNAQYLNLKNTIAVAGSNITLTFNDPGHTMTITATGGGGGGVSGPGSSLNGELPVFQGTSGAAITNTGCVPTANGFSLIAAANYAAMRTLLGLGSAALQNTGTSGANVPLLNGANTWSTTQTLTVAPVFTDQSGSRTALGLGSAATHAATDFEPAGAYSAQNNQTASYTLVLADQGKLVTLSNASANTLTIPKNASVAFPVLARIDFIQTGAGQTTLTPDTGVTLNATPGLKLRAQNSGCSLVKTATDTWQITGDLSA